MVNINDVNWLQTIKGLCPNIIIEECPLSRKYMLYNTETDEMLEIPHRLILDIRGTGLAQIVYNFEKYGLEEAKKVLNHYKVKDTPLYKVLNGNGD